MDKLLEKVDKEINVLTEGDLNPQTIDTLGKLIDIKKDVSKIGYYKDIKEENTMRYYDDYGRRRRDSRGRYMEGRDGGRYGNRMPDMYWDRVMDGYDGYMEGREMDRRDNYNGKGQSVESLEKMLDGIVAFVEDIQNDPEQMEEKEVVNHYIRKLREM